MTAKSSSRAHARLRDIAHRHSLSPQVEQEIAALLDAHRDDIAGQHRAVVARWGDRVRTDPEIGRNAFAATLHLARQAVDRFGGEPLKQALSDTGAGSHPEVIRAFYKVAKAMPPEPSRGPARTPPHEQTMRAMYPTMYGAKI